MASAWDIPVVPHGSAFFSTHFQMANTNSPFQEVLAMSKDGMEIQSIFGSAFTGDPLPEHGQVRPPDRPGWGIAMNHAHLRRARLDA